MLIKIITWTIHSIFCLEDELQVYIACNLAESYIHTFPFYLSPFLPFLPLTDQGATTVLGYHTANGGMTPTASNRQFNPVRDNNNIIVDTCPTQATVRKYSF